MILLHILSRATSPGINSEGPTVTTVTRISTPRGPFPVTVGAFQTPRAHGGPKLMTVTSYKDRDIRGPIPATVGSFETRREHEEPKAMTVTGMAALRRQKR